MKCVLVMVLSLGLCIATISPGDKNKSQQKVIRAKKGPVELDVFERKLIDLEPSPQEILMENAAYCKSVGKRHFNGTVLGYVTPVSIAIPANTWLLYVLINCSISKLGQEVIT